MSHRLHCPIKQETNVHVRVISYINFILRMKSEVYTCTLSLYCRQPVSNIEGQLEADQILTAQTFYWAKMESMYVPVLWRSCSMAAGTVSRNTKRGLLEKPACCGSCRPGPQDVPPLSILILAFGKHPHLLAGKGSCYWLFVAVLKVTQS